MKCLLGLLLVMGMVGCGQKENAGNAVDPSIGADEQLVTDSGGEKSDPSNPNVKVDEPPVQAVNVDLMAAFVQLAYDDSIQECTYIGTSGHTRSRCGFFVSDARCRVQGTGCDPTRWLPPVSVMGIGLYLSCVVFW